MTDVNNLVKEIKQSFRQLMDGATAQSMRDKGLHYSLNWGVTLPRLREMADETAEGKDPALLYDLSIALWKENVRECKILATMLMPADRMLPEVADIWMEQTPTLEIAEQAAFNLYQYLPYAADKAYQWLASPEDLPQICGYHVLGRLFSQGQEPNERGINEFIDQAVTAMQGPSLSLRKAALNALNRFATLGLLYERLAQSALRRTDFSTISSK
ncbi:MAG: DNA alkylation repair protein [Prevotella sp.]|nr:DNA alkylation repair protein [Prevotella sp.]